MRGGNCGGITSSSDVPIEIKCVIGYEETTKNQSSTRSPNLHFRVIWSGHVGVASGSEDKWTEMLTQMPSQV